MRSQLIRGFLVFFLFFFYKWEGRVGMGYTGYILGGDAMQTAMPSMEVYMR